MNDFRYLGPRYALRLDWDDPWYSRFEIRNLQRQYSEPASVFLYVEPYEVRVEVVVRPKDLEPWLDLGIGTADSIPAAKRATIRKEVGRFLAEHFELRIDGERVEPDLDRIHFLRRTLRSATGIDPSEDVATIPAVLGAILVVPTSGLPSSASVTWNLWSPRIERHARASLGRSLACPPSPPRCLSLTE